MTKRLTVAQATIEFLKNQYVRRDGAENKFNDALSSVWVA